MAYPTVIVYEQGGMNAEDDPPFTYDQRNLRTWEREAGEADENLFSDENIQEQIRIMQEIEARMTGAVNDGPVGQLADGKYTLFWVSGNPKQVHS